ncbi:MAG: cytochrome c [Deltaproteobacteria bacterium]|nr:cytochrome c [Deltaproteobacteria bacterium]
MRAIGFFLAFSVAACLFASPSYAGVAEGKKAFEAGKCASCHQAEGPAREKTIADQLAKKGPELWYAGSKLKREFLQAWLVDPRPIRPLKYNSLTERNTGGHPVLSPAEANDVTDYLMTLTSKAVKPSGVKPGVNPRGRVIFVKKQACYGCHGAGAG